MDNIQSVVSNLDRGFSCCQSMLSAYGKKLGLDDKLALMLSSAFGGGIAGMGNTCGAVTGSLMVLGLKYGSNDPENEDAKEEIIKLAREFIDRFMSRNGSIMCRELLGIDISTEEGFRTAKEKKLFEKFCPNFVKTAAEIMDEFIKE